MRAKDKDGNLINKLKKHEIKGFNVWYQLTWIKYKVSTDKVLQIEPKQELKKREGKSPDHAEALMLSFADPVGQPSIRFL